MWNLHSEDVQCGQIPKVYLNGKSILFYSLIFFSILDPRDSEITRDTHSLMEEKS